jgi:lipopolysaccharide export system protein LptC
MKQFENIFYIAILGCIGLMGVWLQTVFIAEEEVDRRYDSRHDPDYYVENFVATELDKNGRRRFVIKADRMAHFPDDDTALLDNPHITEFEIGQPPRHTYADSGWMSSSGDEILLTGNVRVVVEAGPDGGGGTMKSKRLRILLNEEQIAAGKR